MSNWIDRRYTFSGTDAKCYAWFPQTVSTGQGGPGGLHLETLQTISVSIREAKSQVRRLGQRSPAGLTRAVRTVAGSMIFAVIDRHPLDNLFAANRAITEGYKYGWSMDMDAITQYQYYAVGNERFEQPGLVAGAMLPFNLLIRHIGEFPKITTEKDVNGREKILAHEMTEILVGVEFIDEGKVISVNDLYSEVTFSFVALDYRPLWSNVTGADRQVLGVDFSPQDNKQDDANADPQLQAFFEQYPPEDMDDPEVPIDPTSLLIPQDTLQIDLFKRCAGIY